MEEIYKMMYELSLNFKVFYVWLNIIRLNTDAFSMSSFFVFVVFVLWLDQGPLFLCLDCEFKRSFVVSRSVVTNTHVPPEVVHSESSHEDIGVVQLVVVADP